MAEVQPCTPQAARSCAWFTQYTPKEITINTHLNEPIRVTTTIAVDVGSLDPQQRYDLTKAIAAEVHRLQHPEDRVIRGWTARTFAEALSRLEADKATVQAEAIRDALRSGGYVSRPRVFKIGNYSAERMLRGFTKPVKRIVAAMKKSGEIPDNACDLLIPCYQDANTVDGFLVDPDLAAFLL